MKFGHKWSIKWMCDQNIFLIIIVQKPNFMMVSKINLKWINIKLNSITLTFDVGNLLKPMR